MRLLLFSVIYLSLTSLNTAAAISDISKIYHEVPALDGLDVCFGGGCAEVRHIFINTQEWSQVVTTFAPKTDDAVLERQQIADAVGVLEVIVGAKVGTLADRAGTFNNSKFPNQLDCNDEAINTTTYMHLMQHYGLIKLHEAEDMRTRGFFFNGWPHTTAVMHEKATGKRFAVDSWFYDNGVPATIVPFELWKSGYTPADSPMRNH